MLTRRAPSPAQVSSLLEMEKTSLALLSQILGARSIIGAGIRPLNRLTAPSFPESRHWTESTETYEAKRSAQAEFAFSEAGKAKTSRGSPIWMGCSGGLAAFSRGGTAERTDRDLVWRRTDAVGSDAARGPTPTAATDA